MLRKTLFKALNGRYAAIALSAAFHLLALMLLIYLSAKQRIAVKAELPKAQVAIKSYIYHAPKPKVIEVTAPVAAKKIEKPQTTATEPVLKTTNADTNTKQPVKYATLQKGKVPQNTEPEETDQDKVAQNEAKNKSLTPPPLPLKKAAPMPESPPKLSAHERLSRLRSAINNSVVNDAYKEYSQVRSASVMDGDQIPVPHSVKKLTPEEEYKKNTVKTGHNTITKNNNGTCTIHREQMLGSPVEATTSGFACGESQFDKNFREHMKKVRARLKPTTE